EVPSADFVSDVELSFLDRGEREAIQLTEEYDDSLLSSMNAKDGSKQRGVVYIRRDIGGTACRRDSRLGRPTSSISATGRRDLLPHLNNFRGSVLEPVSPVSPSMALLSCSRGMMVAACG